MDARSETIIHPLAVVEPGAKLGAGVNIGPFCHVGGEVELGDNIRLISHVTVLGRTTIGSGCTIHPHAALGGPPQNTKHKGGPSTLVIGRNCTIRESVTMHAGTDTSRGETTIGDRGFIMSSVHIGHDCAIGDNVTLASGAGLGGHAEIGDFVSIGGLTAVHQFVRIGHHAFLGGCSAIVGDVIPYGIAAGNRASLRGLNLVGMKRSGMPRKDIYALREAYRMIFDRARPISENIPGVIEKFSGSPTVLDIVEFITGRGKRSFCVPPLDGVGPDDDDAAE